MRTDRAYQLMFRNFPDVLTVQELGNLLGISKKTSYKLLKQGCIPCLKVGREYRIPKINVINYLLANDT